jgi:hypothetical protein
MIVQVNVATYLASERLLDADLVPVTTKVNGDWTKTATLLGTATTATPTITHRAGGIYDILATLTATGVWSVEYSVVVDGETILFDPQTVTVVTAAQADPAGSLSGSRYTTTSPIAQSGLVTIVRGDDYNAADGVGRKLEWVEEDGDNWPDLTSATIAFGAVNTLHTTQTITASGSVIVATGEEKTVRVEVPASATATKTPGTYKFTVRATLPTSSRKVTLVKGTLVLEDTQVA